MFADDMIAYVENQQQQQQQNTGNNKQFIARLQDTRLVYKSLSFSYIPAMNN